MRNIGRNKMRIAQATLDEVYEHFGRKTGDLILNEEQAHFILWEGETPIGYTAIRPFKGYYKSQANYVKPEYRRKGYFSFMLWCMMDKFRDKPIKADCLESSYGIYRRLGFRLVKVKHFKGGNMYSVEWEGTP